MGILREVHVPFKVLHALTLALISMGFMLAGCTYASLNASPLAPSQPRGIQSVIP